MCEKIIPPIQITDIYQEEIALEQPFLEIAERFAAFPGTVVLLSGGRLDCARYHILATRPWFSVLGFGRTTTIRTGNRESVHAGNLFDQLRNILKQFHCSARSDLPVEAGLFGYLAYDLKDHIEKLPRTTIDDTKLPQLCLFAPSIILIRDRVTRKTTLCIPIRREIGEDTLAADLDFFHRVMARPAGLNKRFQGMGRRFSANFDPAEYRAAIQKIRDYIAAGDVYQVNMSQRFRIGFSGSAFHLFQSLYQTNPAPFFAYVEAGDHQIVSTSPERFLQLNGNQVETRPIKGTRPRGKTAEEDQQMGRELLESRKDDAELSMIVDLLRNDIGKVCSGGSVRVTQHKRLEEYENVFHLVSIVEGRLSAGKNAVDLIQATFPGGSITGCPKIRSMEIIDELEPCRRHVYTGSIGYISFHDTMDLSIAIRTATIQGDQLFFSAGGGIVYDSDPSEEYQETMHKGKTLIKTLESVSSTDASLAQVWINGRIKPLDRASLPVADPGVQYGYGLFETIRVVKGQPAFLQEHLQRFHQSWENLMDGDPPDLTWEDIIGQVIHANGLADKVAAVKILATCGRGDTPHQNPGLVVFARPYVHRLQGKKDPGIHLITYPQPRQTPLANHKTLNYLYYYQAGTFAREKGGDEALILNPDQTISETNTANILLVKGNDLIIPRSPAVLPGIMADIVSRHLRQKGLRLQNQLIRISDLFQAEQVLLTNSLMGAVPVLSLDGKPLPGPSDLYRQINTAVL